MAIDIDLTILDVRWPLLFCSETDLFTIISTSSKNEQKFNVGNLKKFKIFVRGTWNPAILRLQSAWNYGR